MFNLDVDYRDDIEITEQMTTMLPNKSPEPTAVGVKARAVSERIEMV